MSQSEETRVIPKKQMTSTDHGMTPVHDMSLDSPSLDDLICSPTTKSKLLSLKRKASQTLEQGSPTVTASFLKWRLSTVEEQLAFRGELGRALKEQLAQNPTNQRQIEERQVNEREELKLAQEKAVLLMDSKCIEGDLNDTVLDKESLLTVYITELRMCMEVASSLKQKPLTTKHPRLSRNRFAKVVHEYLGTERQLVLDSDIENFCNVLGAWFPKSSITCAHIVPWSWNTKDFAHVFGADEPPLRSPRNGLSVVNKIEEGYDNCWITIVPLDTVQPTPTEWKIVLLNNYIREKTVYTDIYKRTDIWNWKWKDIDGRKLTFLNDNRPARRFLYLRYTLAWLHAEDKLWEGFREKVPPGQVWASPNKPDGYLRKSVLVELGRRTGDRLPKELIDAGGFEDPATSNANYDEATSLRVTHNFKSHLQGQRDPKG